ncbi:TIR domain-containing protein [Cryobacterium glaciale]|uniref:TIR domain-containing protein n=1 Tax=Cryobacterium glaciale TaxID=1259145 RepID=A0A4R8V319_9MICO|nr:TIR domain-containing protein [Cryobacterium glaciale]TFB75446.1 TIR domain-containing protein [Cryobacterium glaciale]
MTITIANVPALYRLDEVFNEAGLPAVTYVPPKEAKQLKGSLLTRGKHVTLVGPSGSGKSTVATRLLNELGFDKTRVHMFSGRTYSQYSSIFDVLATEFETESSADALEEWLKLYELIVIDDVHHLSAAARSDLAMNLKLWHERGIRFFMIGIAKTGEDILGKDPELAIRNDQWKLGPQGRSFLEQVLALGESALNVSVDAISRDTAISAAQGSPSIFQAICRVACVEADVLGSQPAVTDVAIELPVIRESVVRQYDGRYLNKIVNLARGRRQARSVHDTYYRMVEQIARSVGKQQVSRDELYHKIVGSEDARQKSRQRNSFYRAVSNLPKVIEEHGLSDILIYENDTLTIDDPVFRFYLDNLDFSRVRAQVNLRRVGYEYDVAVSFAGADRPIVSELFEALKSRGLEVFYDFDQQAALWGKDLRKELARVYSEEALFMIVCLSDEYPEKDWPTFELEVGREAAKKRTGDYLLPLIVGANRPQIVGLPSTIGHLSIHDRSIEDIADLAAEKIHTLAPLNVDTTSPESTPLD